MTGLRATPPLAAKVRHGADGPEVLVVGSAASLLEGDRLVVTLLLGAGARLTVSTVAAQLAHPCPGGGHTAMSVRAELGPDARLRWRPEPTVVCGGGRHHATGAVTLAAGAEAWWLDEVVLGRSGEDPASASLVAELTVDGPDGPLLRDGLDTTVTHAHGPAVLGVGVRYVGAQHCWGRRSDASGGEGAVRFDLAGPGTTWRVLAADVAAGRAALAGVAVSPSR